VEAGDFEGGQAGFLIWRRKQRTFAQFPLQALLSLRQQGTPYFLFFVFSPCGRKNEEQLDEKYRCENNNGE
jgi:hypothetical protein